MTMSPGSFLAWQGCEEHAAGNIIRHIVRDVGLRARHGVTGGPLAMRELPLRRITSRGLLQTKRRFQVMISL
jgi:hypothetical protein